MKKYLIKGFLLLATSVSIIACSEEKLDPNSVLPLGEVDDSPEGLYLEKTFREPYNIRVEYKHNRNMYGVGRDPRRNLYPPARASVIPAMEMVNNVWIETYKKIAGQQFVQEIRPTEFLLAGGRAINEDNTETLGLATGGTRVTLYKLDRVVENPEEAREFIHTIQHEYIHIINMKSEFDENDFGSETVAHYTPTWYQPENMQAANSLGFVTGYARSNIFEDFAETASYMLTNTPAQYAALLASVSPDAASKISNKVDKVRAYFKDYFEIDFDELAKIANQNSAASPLLNRAASNNTSETFGLKTSGDHNNYVHQCQFHSHTEKISNQKHELTKQ